MKFPDPDWSPQILENQENPQSPNDQEKSSGLSVQYQAQGTELGNGTTVILTTAYEQLFGTQHLTKMGQNALSSAISYNLQPKLMVNCQLK